MTEGFADASMSAIAARVGGSKGTLYNYFSSKQDLFAAVIQDDCDRNQTALFDSLEAEGDDVEAVLRGLGLRYAELLLSEPAIRVSRIVIAEAVRFPQLAQVLHEAGPKRGRARLVAYFEHQIQAEKMPSVDTARLVDQFCDMCLGGLYRQRLMNVAAPPTRTEMMESVDSATAVILAAYGLGPQAGVRPLLDPPGADSLRA